MSNASGAKRGPYAATRERRERISGAVIDLVDESGLDAVTIAAVAERSGMSERTVIYHFPSKDHLLVAALELIDDRSVPEPGTTTEFDLDGLRARAASLRENTRRLQLFLVLKGYSALPDHPASEYFRLRSRRVIGFYTTAMEQGRLAGHVHPGLDLRATAIQFSALWDGLTGMVIYDEELDIGPLLVDGFRRLTGANWMQFLDVLARPDAGL